MIDISIRKYLCNLLGCVRYDSDVPSPEIVGTIELIDLKIVLEGAFGDIPFLLPDYHYGLATKESYKEFLRQDTTDTYIYTGDSEYNHWDCENYCYMLHGNLNIPEWAGVPKGICWLSNPAHAVNIFVDENLDVYYVEPQEDIMYLVKEKTDWEPYIVWL